MVFGFSWGEIALILGASAALFGPKDIIVIGRAAGRYTGKAVGYIQSARGQLDPILQRSEINTVHKELRETMAQLEAIRHEMRTGISIMNPGPITRRVMETAVQSQGKGEIVGVEPPAPIADPLKSTPFELFSHKQTVMQKQESGIAPNVVGPTVPITILSNASMPSSQVSGAPVGLAAIIQSSQVSERSDGGSPSQEVVILPISAVEAGLLPSNEEPLSGGADIVFASIMERKVAFQSKKFFEQGS